MNFEKRFLYHLYNQGNNRRVIFFRKTNYFYFLEKMRTYILPYADILAWCLMPNHFHIMIYVNEVFVNVSPGSSQGVTISHPLTVIQTGLTNRSLNDSIAILLRSYTRAINKQENFSGSLFRSNTKAECLNCQDGVSTAWLIEKGMTIINVTPSEKQYPQICFDYIHHNPVKANLVAYAGQWDYSSFNDYFHGREGTLVNKIRAMEFVNL